MSRVESIEELTRESQKPSRCRDGSSPRARERRWSACDAGLCTVLAPGGWETSATILRVRVSLLADVAAGVDAVLMDTVVGSDRKKRETGGWRWSGSWTRRTTQQTGYVIAAREKATLCLYTCVCVCLAVRPQVGCGERSSRRAWRRRRKGAFAVGVSRLRAPMIFGCLPERRAVSSYEARARRQVGGRRVDEPAGREKKVWDSVGHDPQDSPVRRRC